MLADNAPNPVDVFVLETPVYVDLMLTFFSSQNPFSLLKIF